MPKFEKKFVHFTWDDSLTGKRVFFADGIENLKLVVESESNYGPVLLNSLKSNYPFIDDSTGYEWSFVYYDPHYELKLAYEQGKTIQIRHKETGQWVSTPIWEWDENIEYRVKPEETNEESFVTKRELAMWIAKGNGEWKLIAAKDVDSCLSHYPYSTNESDSFISSLIVIRKWEDTEWVKPTREYMGLD